MNKDILREIAGRYGTPSFVFDTDEFHNRITKIRNVLGENIPLCYSVKANAFMLHSLAREIRFAEVCSPGELEICKRMKVEPSRILYSGVNKGPEDIACAIEYGAAVLTAESRRHVDMINDVSAQKGKVSKIILRLTSGNQFGMDPEEIVSVIRNRKSYPHIDVSGLHYYSGTQKKSFAAIEKDVAVFEAFLSRLENEYGYKAEHVEYGPGLASDYFVEPYEETDISLLTETGKLLREFGQKYPLCIEMGRFMAASCGTYLTGVADIKTNCGTTYVICDGGIHHLKYYGQTMAMQVPPIDVLSSGSGDRRPYTLCGSLCTTADLLVRKAELPSLSVGDVLAFGRCGAYSVTEGTALFLSRTMPRVILYSEKDGTKLVRDFYETGLLNC